MKQLPGEPRALRGSLRLSGGADLEPPVHVIEAEMVGGSGASSCAITHLKPVLVMLSLHPLYDFPIRVGAT
jgi:hypothetical protein